MIWVHLWQESMYEWQLIGLEIPLDTDPDAIVRAVDEAITEGLGFSPSERFWTLKGFGRAGPLLTIECRSSLSHLGIILVNYEENGSRSRPAESPSDHEYLQSGSESADSFWSNSQANDSDL
jgi:hypothetical protein